MALLTVFPEYFSPSALNELSMCELRWFRKYCQKLHPLRSSFNYDLSAGGIFAKGIESARESYYVNGNPANESVEIGLFAMQELFDEIEQNDLEIYDAALKNPERMKLALQEYFKKFPFDEEDLVPILKADGSRTIEFKFESEIPITHPETGKRLKVLGILDMLAQNGKRTYIIDEKTTKSITENTGKMLQTSGQFLAYAWLAKQKRINVSEVKVRKVAIQVKEIKIQEFVIPITEFAVDNWYRTTLNKIQQMVTKYNHFLINKDTNPETKEPIELFSFDQDFGIGCTSFNKPCNFSESCIALSSYNTLVDITDDGFGMSDFEQKVSCDSISGGVPSHLDNLSFDSKYLTIQEYRNFLGLK